MVRSPISGAAALLLLGFIHAACAEDQPGPLDREIGARYSYGSFNEAVQQIETKTGFKVRCPKELADYMQSLFMGIGVGDPKDPEPEPQQTTRAFLDQICGTLSVTWKFDPATRTLDLDHPWHTEDPRSPAEILKTLQNTRLDPGEEKKWQAEFTALVSKPENIGKAWKVLQTAAMEDAFAFFRPRKLKPVLVKPILSTSLRKYIIVLIEEPIRMYPGHGSASYFCFNDDGTLALAGIMNTGHRCALVDALVDNEYGARSGSPSEIHMVLKVNLRDFYIARFHLEDEGLKLFSLADGYSQPVDTGDRDIGASLLK